VLTFRWVEAAVLWKMVVDGIYLCDLNRVYRYSDDDSLRVLGC
jgi:hypothetical protein